LRQRELRFYLSDNFSAEVTLLVTPSSDIRIYQQLRFLDAAEGNTSRKATKMDGSYEVRRAIQEIPLIY
jgi:hypothetical protein